MPLIEEIPERRPSGPQARKLRFQDEPLASKTSGKALVLPLVLLHATLVALVRFQYGQEVEPLMVLKESWAALPIFYGLFHYLHPHLGSTRGQAAIALATVGAGGYLVHIANDLGYYAVMSRAPPVGSLVVWAFLELNLAWSFVVVVLVAVFMGLMGYSL